MTIDDTSGDPLTGDIILYEPASSWRSGNQNLCMNCIARPDASGETWHEGASFSSQSGAWQSKSQVLTASVPFNGSAVYVYGIIAPFWRTDLAFYLDGERAATFALEVNTSRAYGYESGATTTGGGNDTLVLLDRVVYTHDSGLLTTPSNTTSPPAASSTSTSFFSGPSATSDPRPNIVATSPSNVYVIGGMLVMGLVIAAWGRLWRRYKRGRLPPSTLHRRSAGAGAGASPGMQRQRFKISTSAGELVGRGRRGLANGERDSGHEPQGGDRGRRPAGTFCE
ncbi:hypothetical protein GSI_07067 [Ganoderma sinense ZZ0214-1]|uniref:Uncharacterized protein n=1 Tax=Ganoderma sinense ZZ0214-1 TaxID=1077348 RepID=A0A2G8SBB9_9APHY|nr:hypothetical protein GSI_07067 [Ganoderma sinense ZZ0214-1]